ncbi:MAG: UvrB/UvrC motif-containing protein, partial [Deltaproteobacteria bacterium]|nr:UvrB/UvrC motif-containing protein [Deltaproteobacteria bacterium]
ELARHLRKLRKEMEKAAKNLDFERAAEIRDRLLTLERVELKAR